MGLVCFCCGCAVVFRRGCCGSLEFVECMTTWPNNRVDRTVAEPRRFAAAAETLSLLRDGVARLSAPVGHSNRWAEILCAS